MIKSLPNKLFTLLFFLLVSKGLAQTSRENYIALDRALGDQSFFSGHLTGFLLYDLDSQRVLFEKNSQIRFIPASTTKLWTLFAASLILQDSTQTLRYVSSGDTLKIWGSGDPSWKYKEFKQPDFQKFLSPYKIIQFSDANQVSPAFGYGWQWDDYYYDYSAERSSLPIYGNLVEVKKVGNRPEVFPKRFQSSISITDRTIRELERKFHSNGFEYNPNNFSGGERFIPLITSPQLTVELATEITGKKWIYKPEKLPAENQIWRGAALAPLLQEMMLESDNFIAEQMLFMVSDRLFQTLDTERAIEYMVKTYLGDLPDSPKWVDGSGLSRHNLFTPRSMVALMEKLYRVLPESQLYSLLPTGGQTGTLKNSFQAAQPYIFAKTGTMSNNYSLVGLIKTKSGKTYCFAFMNSNYPYSASVVRKEVEKVMILVRDIF
ncbi:D-alanyl-D-alanine carboxypeptidase/D-alanyl-D-alanine-endopeptidase (penicillin-binding protein 4) [Algoriphagus boseongensis]|uniref:D-alanyl-D-alanine carboxypeptidase/D-alanyl-D-alanine-endopeptidase (Penicillin-binding protein 4) n=1 Tax=Algoriphagus boseongensis TaxID=1442587 RepID=A0A4R6T785_9BACT|nr:D-alanyl-D-alanine carboxypeptidase [Algoriphagus boseongensis]TDQ18860.1 D-alanyl-D-alanine carboxypeptidase/D-alanyl-D-alanine-endopeptidase (penicillin-binding protein 4) [Algoriphagus boseongensis]